MRKILVTLITITLCFNTFAFGAYDQVNPSDKSKAVKELIYSKTDLSNSVKGKKFIKIIDKFIEINKNNETELLKMFNKISPVLEEGKIKSKESLNILKYMNARTEISLINLYNTDPQETTKNTIDFKEIEKETSNSISLTGYAMDARNSKRRSDIGNIQAAISLKKVEGVPLSSFVIQNAKYVGKDLYVGGNKLILGENYFVGTLNYSVLNVNKNDFLDPDGSEYLIGVTTENDGMFQIFSKMENGEGYNMSVTGTYYPRDMSKKTNFTIINDNTIDIDDSYINYFKKGNITNFGKISKISRDGITLTFEKTIDKNIKEIYLLKNDSVGLISIDGKIIKNIDFKETEKEVSNSLPLAGYSMDARNSKRLSDIGNIQSAISLKKVEGVPLSSFVIQNSKYAGKDLYVGGNKLILGENYFIGTLNYSVLNVNKNDFLDPDGSEYLIGVTTENDGMFQIFSKMENGEGYNMSVTGTYNPRDMSKKTNFTIINDNTIDIDDSYVNYFKKGNITNFGKISKISRDGITLTFEKTIDKNIKEIYLLKNDSVGLISIDGKIIKNMDIMK